MKDCREEWYDADKRVAVTIVDVTGVAQDLARAHLAGPVATHFIAEALAAAALLSTEVVEKDEALSIQMKCSGPLGGYNVECTSEGTLRGYTERKTLDEFDGLGKIDVRKIVGDSQIQVSRTVPGRIISQGISKSFDGYLAGSLQRKARMYLSAAVSDEVEVLEARGILVEALPDSACQVNDFVPEELAVSSRTILSRIGLKGAELKKTTPLSFACRCSPERAAAMLKAMSDEERAGLPPQIDITCHMCGKIYTVR